MDKIWFLFINEKQEGPFSYFELKKDPRLTPETFAWKEGMGDWKKIKEIPELKNLFKHEEVKEIQEDEPQRLPESDEIAIDWGKGPYFNLWLLIALLLILYILYILSQ